jgi:hypothetical protein
MVVPVACLTNRAGDLKLDNRIARTQKTDEVGFVAKFYSAELHLL